MEVVGFNGFWSGWMVDSGGGDRGRSRDWCGHESSAIDFSHRSVGKMDFQL